MGGAHPSYSFELADSRWLQHLVEQGFCVVRGAADPSDVEVAKALLWSDLEAAHGALRGKPETWDAWRLPQTGLMAHLAQSAGAWSIRGLPNVRKVYERVWGTDDLIVSMDAILAWRPWHQNKTWQPHTEGLHLDQNPFSKPHLDCVQGMLPLLDVTEGTGGLQVVPRSHLDAAKEEYKLRYPECAGSGDWCPLGHDDPMQAGGILLQASAGDLVLWDSRTVHGGLVGTGSGLVCDELARLSVTVAMTPRELANEQVQRLRREGFQAKESFNHCPHEAGTSSGTIKRKLPRTCVRLELNDVQQALL